MKANRKNEIQKQISELYARYRKNDKSAALILSGYIECLTLQGYQILGYDEKCRLISEPRIA